MTREGAPVEREAGDEGDARGERMHDVNDTRGAGEAGEGSAARGLAPGAAVLVVLHTPREKCWGVLGEISAAGVFLRGLDLNAFDDFVRGVASGEPSLGPSEVFFPMWRVERVALDERAGDVPSLAEQFESRTGRMLREFF